jgi:hypothetical protein
VRFKTLSKFSENTFMTLHRDHWKGSQGEAEVRNVTQALNMAAGAPRG